MTISHSSERETTIRNILQEAKTIAVVGFSTHSDRPGYYVPAYLQAHGYCIIPINPNLMQALGEKAYHDLLAIPEPVDHISQRSNP